MIFLHLIKRDIQENNSGGTTMRKRLYWKNMTHPCTRQWYYHKRALESFLTILLLSCIVNTISSFSLLHSFTIRNHLTLPSKTTLIRKRSRTRILPNSSNVSNQSVHTTRVFDANQNLKLALSLSHWNWNNPPQRALRKRSSLRQLQPRIQRSLQQGKRKRSLNQRRNQKLSSTSSSQQQQAAEFSFRQLFRESYVRTRISGPGTQRDRNVNFNSNNPFASSGSSKFVYNNNKEYGYEEDEYDFDDDDDDDGIEILTYLPISVRALPPKTKDLLQKVTQIYTTSDIDENDSGDEGLVKDGRSQQGQKERQKQIEKNIEMKNTLEIIEQEYQCASVDFFIHDDYDDEESMINSNNKSNENSGSETSKMEGLVTGGEISDTEERFAACNILSFAALHRLPAEITILLFGVLDASNNRQEQLEGGENRKSILFERIRNALSTKGWKAITFPQGLSLRIKRTYAPSKRIKYYPLPRKSLFTRSKDIIEAEIAVREAHMTKPPPKKISQQRLLAEMNELFPPSGSSNRPSSFRSDRLQSLKDNMSLIGLTFFPNRSKFRKRFSRAVAVQTKRLRAAGRAGLLCYGVLNFLWYTFAVLWQWKRETRSMSTLASTAATAALEGAGSATISSGLAKGNADAVRISVQKFSKVLLTTYVGSQLTKVPRMALAVAMAPLGNKLLGYTERKLRVSEDTALGILSVGLVAVCFVVWSAIILLDAMFSNLGTFAM